ANQLLPDQPREVDVDSLVQKLFGFTPTYTDPGDGILGFIRFDEAKPAVIIIAESLAKLGSDTTEHRRRSTLAHEIGHGRLHAGPFTELVQAKRSGYATELVRSPGTTQASFACRAKDIRDNERDKSPALSGLAQWERMAEWQANRYMAAVTAPARLVRMAVAEALHTSDEHAHFALTAELRARLAPEISERFNVSRQLADIRLAELFPEPTGQADFFTLSAPPREAAHG
ncbi:MAG: hypothetical protein ABII82_01770, partial [Verrucomicrobiota bacterium]